MVLGRWVRRGLDVRRDAYALYLACRDPRVPWYAKLVAAAVVAYVVSPVDLVPDFIPLVGHLDDVILVLLGLRLVWRLVGPELTAEHRERASGALLVRAFGRPGAALTIALWLAVLAVVVGLYLLLR